MDSGIHAALVNPPLYLFRPAIASQNYTVNAGPSVNVPSAAKIGDVCIICSIGLATGKGATLSGSLPGDFTAAATATQRGMGYKLLVASDIGRNITGLFAGSGGTSQFNRAFAMIWRPSIRLRRLEDVSASIGASASSVAISCRTVPNSKRAFSIVFGWCAGASSASQDSSPISLANAQTSDSLQESHHRLLGPNASFRPQTVTFNPTLGAGSLGVVQAQMRLDCFI